MQTITCPHCGASNAVGGAFCESCGKALPSAAPTGPRIVSADALPQSTAGHTLVRDDLRKEQKSASTALLVVAILQLTCGALILVVLNNARPSGAPPLNPIVFAIQFGIAALFFGLYFWSRRSPLPASIVGFVLYATLVAMNMIAAISNMSLRDRNTPDPTRGIGGLGIGWLDIVIMVVLARAIGAGIKHRKLMQQQPGMLPGAPPAM